MNKGESKKGHQLRVKIINFLIKKGGAYFMEIKRGVGIPSDNMVAYHVGQLVKLGKIIKVGSKYTVDIRPKDNTYKYLEVTSKGKVIERISVTGHSPIQVQNRKFKILDNIPSSYIINEVSYPCRTVTGFFSENL